MNLDIPGYNRWTDMQAPYHQLLSNTCNINNLNRKLRGYSNTRWSISADDYLLPYMINDINYHAIQMFIPSNLSDLENREYKDRLSKYTVNIPNTFNMCIVFTNNIDDTNNWMPDTYEELVEDSETSIGVAITQFKDVMQRLFDGFNEDIIDVKFKFFKSNGETKSLITVCNCCYNVSTPREVLFTLALSQLVYPELYAEFTQEEKDVYLEILHQMYLKRIVKSKIQEKANILSTSTKYTNYFSERNVARTLGIIIRQRIDTLKRSSEEQLRRANDLLRQYTQAVASFNLVNEELQAKENNAASELNELKRILNQPYISNVRLDGEYLYLKLESYLDFYDTDLLDCILNGLDDRNITDENYKIFLTEVFKEQHYKLRVQSNFQYSLNRNDIANTNYSLRVNQNDAEAQSNDRLCNPHLYFFSCLGSYAAQLAKAQAETNLDVFIGLALASTRSINFADGAVNSRLKGYFNPNDRNWLDRRCLEDEEGTLYTIKEVIDKVKYADTPVIEPQDTLTPEEREAEFEW